MSSPVTVHVVSPQFPCGAAWLANALLELRVRIDDLWGYDTAREWQDLGEGRRRYVAADLPWLQTLACLRLERVFAFRPDHLARFSHAYPWQLPVCGKTVYMLRDPRDALYSEWRRARQNEGLPASVDLPAFLAQSFRCGPISNAEMLRLHLRAWLSVRSTQALYLLRFEDWKRDPLGQLEQVCRWIGLPTQPKELTQAAQTSDVSHLQRIEQNLLSADPRGRQFNRAGKVFEWRNCWQPAWVAGLDARWQPLLRALGYAPLPASGMRENPSFDLEQVLRWRDINQAEELAYWQRVLAE